MSIKSDHWIRRMAESEGMIEPFQAGQLMNLKFLPMSTRQQLTQRILMKIVLSILRQVSVLSRLILLPWRAPLNTFVFPAVC